MKKLTADRCRKQILRLKKCISEGYVSINERDYLQALEIALPILEQQERGEGGWIEWVGSECPVDGNTMVQIRWSDDSVVSGLASSYGWTGLNFGRIAAYRIIPERPTNQNGEQ